jgi:hypothetical protein
MSSRAPRTEAPEQTKSTVPLWVLGVVVLWVAVSVSLLLIALGRPA